VTVGVLRLCERHIHAARRFIRLSVNRIPYPGNRRHEVAVETTFVAIAATTAEGIIADHRAVVSDQGCVQDLVIDGKRVQIRRAIFDGAAYGNVSVYLEAAGAGNVQNPGDGI